MPKVVPMPPATTVPMTPTISDTRAPKISGERGAGLFGDIRHRFYLPGQADAGVDVGVEDVDRQVDDHDHDAGLHHNALYQREIALEDTLVEEPADAGPGEDDLDDHRGVDHHHEVDAGQAQHRDQRVFEGVHGDHDVARQPFQARQLDVLAAQHFEHRGAGQAQQRGGKIPAERYRRHDQVLPAALAAGRQPAEPDREHQDHHQPEPEAGHRQPEQGDDLAGIVPDAVYLDGGDQPRRDADEERDQGGRQRQL